MFTPHWQVATLENVETILEYLEQRDAAYVSGATKQYTLQRMQAAMLALGSPQDDYINVHIAGTSGKGSTAQCITAILLAAATTSKSAVHRAGHNAVGLYTSPALVSPLERIQVNGRPITPRAFLRVLQHIWPVVQEYRLTYFETFTAVAFVYFSQRQVRYAVLETGLGGRLDATNVSPSHLALITDIGLDHVKQLGSTRAKIAKEKQGIIKPHSLALTTSSYARRAINVQANSARIERRSTAGLRIGTTFTYAGKRYRVGMLGDFQVRNAVLAIRAAQALGIAHIAIVRGLRAAKHPARFQLLPAGHATQPTIIVDGAHNPQKMQAFVQSLITLYPPSSARPKRALLALKHDKDSLATLRPLIQQLTSLVITEFRGHSWPAKALATQVRRLAKQYNPQLDIQVESSSQSAYALWHKQLAPGDIGLITGSLYLIGELGQQRLIHL